MANGVSVPASVNPLTLAVSERERGIPSVDRSDLWAWPQIAGLVPYGNLLEEIRDLRTELSRKFAPIVVPITTLVPEPYQLLRDIPAVVQPADDGYTATFFDANISTSGDTQEEAVSNLRSLVLDIFEFLNSEPPDTLGPEPTRQLGVLRVFLEAS